MRLKYERAFVGNLVKLDVTANYGPGAKTTILQRATIVPSFQPFSLYESKPKSSFVSFERSCVATNIFLPFIQDLGNTNNKCKVKFDTLPLVYGGGGVDLFLFLSSTISYHDMIHGRYLANRWEKIVLLLFQKFHIFCSLLTLMFEHGEHSTQTLKTKYCTFVAQV